MIEHNSKRITVLSVANAAAWVAVIVVNGMANALPINGLTTGELSDMYPNLFVPAGFTFSIWGIIYLLLLGFTIFQFGKEGVKSRNKIGPWWILNAVANIAWILAWHHKMIILSLLIMIVLLISLTVIHGKLGRRESGSLRETLFARLPFSVYLGWICVATIANATTVLVNLEWGGFGLSESIWAVVMISIAFALAAMFLLRHNDMGIGLVVAWAFFGIYSKQIDGATPIVAQVAALGVMLLLAGVVATGIRILKAR